MRSHRDLGKAIAFLLVLTLMIFLSFILVFGQEAASADAPNDPEDPDANPTIYLPLVMQIPPNTIFGHVTQSGVDAPDVVLTLHHYDGIEWTRILTKSTRLNGDYYFTGLAPLLAGQKYEVRYNNQEDDSTRLWTWETRELTNFADGVAVNMGSFDIANVELTSPEPGVEAGIPSTFQWTPRPATPNESYQLNLFDLYDRDPDYYSATLGYVSNYNLNSLPAGFNYCNPYYWGLRVNSPDGGWGYSFWIHFITFYSPSTHSGIHGCVTEGGVPTNGVPLTLWRLNFPGSTEMGTTNTNNGYFQFTGIGDLNPGQSYMVEYENSLDGSNRVAGYGTQGLASYTAGSSVHIGDFDIDNIVLTSPPDGATVALPYTFEWIKRAAPATQWDHYLFRVDDPESDLAFLEYVGYVGQYTLMGLPIDFSYNVPYYWWIWVSDRWGGSGVSYDLYTVTFSPPGMRVAPGEDTRKHRFDRQQLEAMRQARLGQPRAGHEALLRLHPDFEQLQGKR